MDLGGPLTFFVVFNGTNGQAGHIIPPASITTLSSGKGPAPSSFITQAGPLNVMGVSSGKFSRVRIASGHASLNRNRNYAPVPTGEHQVRLRRSVAHAEDSMLSKIESVDYRSPLHVKREKEREDRVRAMEKVFISFI